MVPWPVALILVASLGAQIAWHAASPTPRSEADALPAAPALAVLELAAFGDKVTLAKALMLWLQAHDNQSGVSLPFSALDYTRVTQWLSNILALDPRSGYPLLAAGRVYASVGDDVKRRQMLEFIYDEFLEAPNMRWRWLAHAAIVAKHRLKDLPLALRYAGAITQHATSPDVPAWARDMTAVVLEDMGEFESAKVLIGGLLESGRITDPHEVRFLEEKLKELEEEAPRKAYVPLVPNSPLRLPGE